MATLELPVASPAGRARSAALSGAQRDDAAPTSLVSFLSLGRVLISGPEAAALAAARRLAGELACTVIVPSDEPPRPASADGIGVISGGRPVLTGAFGNFAVSLSGPDGDRSLQSVLPSAPERFDLVLDLGEPRLAPQELAPLGYYAPGDDGAALEDVLAALPEMKGEFEKPKFFNYNPDICAHGRSGVTGCTRCIDACPAEAIVSIGEKVEVSPYLCQGGGSCATACPSGAMTYAYPRVSDLLRYVRVMLRAYRDAGGESPVLLYHDAGSRPLLEQVAAVMPESVLPVEVEEIGSVGMDAWMASLAYGAQAVVLLCGGGTPPKVMRELEAQVEYAAEILGGMGFEGGCLRPILVEEADAALAALADLPALGSQRCATFAAPESKRDILRLAIDHLYAQAPKQRRSVALPAGAPFGEVKVDPKACTLCMSCVGACPTAALRDGGGLPQLKFAEWSCVQCGLCASTCPEDAILPSARFLYDAEARQSVRILHEEQPFCCIVCGKPFATRSMLDQLSRKLEGHWMYQTEEARRRLQMCEHCRVKDMFTGEMRKDA